MNTPHSLCTVRVTRVQAGRTSREDDAVAAEAPLEIRLIHRGLERTLTVTMRTPGADEELALGWLIAERVIDEAAQVKQFARCGARADVLKVHLHDDAAPRLAAEQRSYLSSASCGLCGKSSLEAVFANAPREPAALTSVTLTPSLLQRIPALLRESQRDFERTGGTHAVACISLTGEVLHLREDVGRHNAFDKVIGAALRAGAADLSECVVALSGRAGFELIQKAAVVRAPVMVAIGAPSSLAIELAERTGVTLVGFLRASGFNIYSHPARIDCSLRDVAEVA